MIILSWKKWKMMRKNKTEKTFYERRQRTRELRGQSRKGEDAVESNFHGNA